MRALARGVGVTKRNQVQKKKRTSETHKEMDRRDRQRDGHGR